MTNPPPTDVISGRTQSEVTTARKNADASVYFCEALAAAHQRFEEGPIAVEANRTGPMPRRETTRATNASSLYSSALDAKTRSR